MSTDDNELCRETLEDAKNLDLVTVVVLGVTSEGESHFMYNCEDLTALQILDLFRANFFAQIMQEALSGHSKGKYH